MAGARLGNGARLLLALLASAAIFGLAAVAVARSSGTRLAVGPPGSAQPAWVDGEPVWVVAPSEGDPVVVGAVNPHRWYGIRDIVGWCPSQRIFSAYYDGSRFDEAGHYIFGPAPTGLPRYEVTEAHPGAVTVGDAVASETRTGSEWRPVDGAPFCGGESGIPYDAELQGPMATYHDPATSGRTILDGVIVIDVDGGTFCRQLLETSPLRCRDRPLDVPEVIGIDEVVGVHHGRFAVDRRGGSLLNVFVLPGGYMDYEPR